MPPEHLEHLDLMIGCWPGYYMLAFFDYSRVANPHSPLFMLLAVGAA